MNIIVATNNLNGIGLNGTIPWYNKNDMQFFKMMTYGKHVFMGRKTYKSLGKALPYRYNEVLSSSIDFDENIIIHRSVDFFLSRIKNNRDGFVIGGESIYKMVLDAGIISNIYLSRVNDNHECDKHFVVPENFKRISEMSFSDLIIERYVLR